MTGTDVECLGGPAWWSVLRLSGLCVDEPTTCTERRTTSTHACPNPGAMAQPHHCQRPTQPPTPATLPVRRPLQVVWQSYVKTMRGVGQNESVPLYAASGMLTYGASTDMLRTVAFLKHMRVCSEIHHKEMYIPKAELERESWRGG